MSMRAEIVPGSLNDQDRTVEIIWTTGARVLRSTWWDGDFYEELSLDPKHVRMERFQSGRAPHLVGHNSWDPDAHVGVLESGALEKKRGIGKLRVLKDDEQADKEWNKIRQGVRTSFSVGYRVYKYEKTEAGEGTIPVYRAVDWEPYEVSSVPMPADIGAHTRSATDRSALNPCQVINITRGEPPQKEQSMSKENTQAAPTTTTPPPAAPANTERTAALPTSGNEDKVRAAERERIATIQALVRKHGVDVKVGEKLVNDNATVDEARKAILDALATRSDEVGISGHQRVTGGEDQREKFARGAEAWLISRAGKMGQVQEVAKRGKFAAPETNPGEFRGMTLIALAREYLERKGTNTRMMSDERIATLALTRSPGTATPGDFPILLENVTNKILLSAYETTPHEWSRFCARGSVSNFHAHNRYRKGAFGTLDPVNDAGELKNKPIPDGEKRSVTVGTYGNTIGISRRMLIQDDMGAFTDVAGAFGQTVQNTIEAKVWDTVKANSGLGANYDANPLFHASRANVGTGSALSAAGLDADATLMARQKDPSGLTTLSLVPAILVLPRELRSQATIINNDTFDPDASTKQNRTNPARSMFRDIVASAQISGTRRYLFADPNVAPVIEVTFLQGNEGPTLEMEEQFDTIGIRWRVFADFGVNLVDYRGAVTNAGA